MSDPALLFRDVTVRYEPGGAAAVEAASFSVADGERVALVGLNGSGKTTLLMTAVGLVPHEGEIRVRGEPLTHRTLARIRSRVGFLFNVPEDQLLFPKVVEDVSFGLMNRGLSSAEVSAGALRALDALGVGYLAESPLHHLSHGQKQRVALAGALATDPTLLLLDEPSAALDPPGKSALARLLSRLGAAMIVASHDLAFVRRLCTRFIMLEQGRIVHDGPGAAESWRRWELEESDGGSM